MTSKLNRNNFQSNYSTTKRTFNTFYNTNDNFNQKAKIIIRSTVSNFNKKSIEKMIER